MNASKGYASYYLSSQGSTKTNKVTIRSQHLPRRDDLSPLTDPNFIAKVLTDLPKHVSQREGAKTGWRGLRNKAQIAQLIQV